MSDARNKRRAGAVEATDESETDYIHLAEQIAYECISDLDSLLPRGAMDGKLRTIREAVQERIRAGLNEVAGTGEADAQWFIWSNEHHAWWKPHRHGYVRDITLAGIYSFAEASEICREANAGCKTTDAPEEMMVLAAPSAPVEGEPNHCGHNAGYFDEESGCLAHKPGVVTAEGYQPCGHRCDFSRSAPPVVAERSLTVEAALAETRTVFLFWAEISFSGHVDIEGKRYYDSPKERFYGASLNEAMAKFREYAEKINKCAELTKP